MKGFWGEMYSLSQELRGEWVGDRRLMNKIALLSPPLHMLSVLRFATHGPGYHLPQFIYFAGNLTMGI
jgi:hypothetical protein